MPACAKMACNFPGLAVSSAQSTVSDREVGDQVTTNPDNFEDFMRSYQDMVYSTAMRLLVSDAEAKAEYDKFKAGAAGTEYRAAHILVEKEDEAKDLIKQIKAGGKFDELAKKHSKDPGSGANGGDLDFAKPDAYVPEFSKAMTALKKGEMTEAPVKSQFGWHIIALNDVREAQFPGFEDVKGQIKQRLEQVKLQQYQEELRTKARTDYKFGAS